MLTHILVLWRHFVKDFVLFPALLFAFFRRSAMRTTPVANPYEAGQAKCADVQALHRDFACVQLATASAWSFRREVFHSSRYGLRSSIIFANCAMSRDCAPSLITFSGAGCTSTINPS